jgi:hypothetical protein
VAAVNALEPKTRAGNESILMSCSTSPPTPTGEPGELGALRRSTAELVAAVSRLVRILDEGADEARLVVYGPDRLRLIGPKGVRRIGGMCAACAMAAAAGASGARSWLQTRHMTWLTPRRMRAATVALFVAAFGISTLGLSSSSSAGMHQPASEHAVP